MKAIHTRDISRQRERNPRQELAAAMRLDDSQAERWIAIWEGLR